MEVGIPELALVCLVGPTASGKSTFAAARFLPGEVVSSDFCRFLVAGDENDQSASKDAFDVLQYLVRKRLAREKLTVVDATNVQAAARKPLIALARDHDVPPVAIVFDLPLPILHERAAVRADRDVPESVVARQAAQLRRSLERLEREGFGQVVVIRTAAEAESVRIVRTRLPVDRREDHGPFDVVGDVHGCLEELLALLRRLGYDAGRPDGRWQVAHPAGRRIVFLGDLVDRGPDSPGTLRLVMDAVEAGSALCVAGDDDVRLAGALRSRGRPSRVLAGSLVSLAREPREERLRAAAFLDRLLSHYVLDDGRLVVAHAGLPERLQGRASRRVREFALHGETAGEAVESGLPGVPEWARAYGGEARVVYGHTPALEPVWVNRTIDIDTGCVFGGRLTALRYPELELVSVPAARSYHASVRTLF